jgi:GNAT superfamily N-acetyltransferase
MAVLRDQFHEANVTIKVNVAESDVMAWETQVVQYPSGGSPGISYLRGQVDPAYYVDCLLFRGDDGELIGVLNHFPADYPPYERAGNVNIWVRPDRQRQGVARALILEALGRWEFRWENQRITPSGARIAASMVREFGEPDQ